MEHITVLQKEAVDGLNVSPHAVVIDATFGSGGHGKEICERLDQTGIYVGIDADKTAFNDADDIFAGYPAQKHFVTANFTAVRNIVADLQLPTPHAILADLGWRSPQFLSGGKGFSFRDDSPLLMTYGDPSDYLFTAQDIVNEWDEEHIADVIYGYGEERASRSIARAIVAARHVAPIHTAQKLADIISTVVRTRPGMRTHPATKTFQALRIAVNDELGAVHTLISDGMDLLCSGGRLAIISFHSLEDRIVKQQFRNYTRDQHALLITKKPIVPTREEVLRNPRARSAKLRIIEKI